jgi:nickel transport protein
MQKDRMFIKRIPNNKSMFLLFIFAALWLVFPQEQALAHKATIFAWIEGDTIHTQSKLSGGKRVKGGEVIVFNQEGVPLLKGKTDNNGMFSFTMPQKIELKIVLKASMGHQAEWSILPEEMGGSGPESNTSETVQIAPVKKSTGSKDIETREKSSKRADVGLSREDIQKIIDDALEKKLAPVLDKMAKTYDQGPGLTKIIGGIGYIIGLVGVALVVTSRRRKK